MIRPMLAKASDAIPSGAFTFEVKWDGVRGIARVDGGEVELYSRSGKSEFSSRFANVARDLARFPDCVLDGELVRFDEDGRTAGLGANLGPSDGSYVVFDLLELGGNDLCAGPIELRRGLLNELLADYPSPSIAASPVFDDGEALYETVAEEGLEGIVAKRVGSRYLQGHRGEAWLKVKVRQSGDFVVCGWTDGKNGRAGHIGGLLLSYLELDESGYWFVYAGRAGARLDDEAELLASVIPTESPQVNGITAPERKGAHWCEPTLVVEVEFQRWTDDGRLWHPICKRIRHDKVPDECRYES